MSHQPVESHEILPSTVSHFGSTLVNDMTNVSHPLFTAEAFESIGEGTDFHVWVLALMVGVVLAVLVTILTTAKDTPKYQWVSRREANSLFQ